MKKSAIILFSILSSTIYSCKTSSHGNCDAYGQAEEQEEEQEIDIHKLSIESSKKYMTTTTLVIK